MLETVADTFLTPFLQCTQACRGAGSGLHLDLLALGRVDLGDPPELLDFSGRADRFASQCRFGVPELGAVPAPDNYCENLARVRPFDVDVGRLSGARARVVRADSFTADCGRLSNMTLCFGGGQRLPVCSARGHCESKGPS